MRMHLLVLVVWHGLVLSGLGSLAASGPADLILHNAKVVTVDGEFSVQQAIAVQGEQILRVGSDREVLDSRGPETTVIDLQGKMVLPGLIDSHTHPTGAAMHEFDHPIPSMESIPDVLEYIRGRAKVLEPGEWILVSQVFITRLQERRYPTRQELDEAAPEHPVLFRTGPDAALNSLALELSGIDRDFEVDDDGAGHIERDPETGEPTGILRSCTRYVKYRSPKSGRSADQQDRYLRLKALFQDYNAVGLTAVADRNASGSALGLYERLLDNEELSVRVAASHGLNPTGDPETIRKRLQQIAEHPLRQGGPMLRIVGVKTFLDGGMLTGSAYMRQPWGLSRIYSIDDPEYRGLLFIPPHRLVPIVQATVELGLQFTAHSVGDGAVHTLLEAYEQVNQEVPIAATRPCITHCNFMSREAVQKMAALDVVADIQPAWLWLDTRTLVEQFGYDRLRYFQPLQSLFQAGVVVGGGSDHMQKIGSLRSVNPYNPWLGMWVTLTRQAHRYEGALHEQEALSREQALRFYTINNAHLLFLEDQVGSLEAGKLADLIVIDRDILTCSLEQFKDTRVLQTYLAGRQVHPAPAEEEPGK